LTDTTIDPGTVQAYLETHYQVFVPTPLTLRIGAANAGLADLHRRQGVQASAFITACNPLGREVSKALNIERQQALAESLSALDLAFIDGVGQHPSGKWDGEASFLVFGLTLESSRALGERWEQNAIVWCGADAVPQLILLR
jgi:hypothetical protein